jgi:hypothetical protein
VLQGSWPHAIQKTSWPSVFLVLMIVTKSFSSSCVLISLLNSSFQTIASIPVSVASPFL